MLERVNSKILSCALIKMKEPAAHFMGGRLFPIKMQYESKIHFI